MVTVIPSTGHWSHIATYSFQGMPQITGLGIGTLRRPEDGNRISTPLQPSGLGEGAEQLHSCYCNLRGWRSLHFLVHSFCRAKEMELCVSGYSPHLSLHHVARPPLLGSIKGHPAELCDLLKFSQPLHNGPSAHLAYTHADGWKDFLHCDY